MKQKRIAALLAFFLGIFGAHRFYLGQRFFGIVICTLTTLAFIITTQEGVPLIIAPAVFAFVESVLFAVMPREDFDEKYNTKYLSDKQTAEFDEMEEAPYQGWSYQLQSEAKKFKQEMTTEAAAFTAMPPLPEEEQLELKENPSLDLLDQITHYGNLRDQGLLTEEEFEHLKKRLL